MDASNGRDRVVNAAIPAPTPTLTVAAVARRLGVAPPTLRTWDRRYGLGPSAHTAGAHRRYSPADVARLMVMRRLTLEGVAPADAAKIAVATPVTADGQPMHTPADGYDLSPASVDAATSGANSGEPVPAEGSGSRFGSTDFPDADFPSSDFPDAEFGDAEFGGAAFVGVEAVEPELEDIILADLAELVADASSSGGPGSEALGIDDLSVLAGSAGLAPDQQVDLNQSDDLNESDDLNQSDDEADGGSDESGEEDPTWSGVLRSVGTERGGTPGGGRIVAMPDGTPQSRGLARAAMSLDTYEMHRIVQDAVRRQGTIRTWNTLIMPVLRALGERTRVSGDGIDVEHAFSEVILGVMRAVAIAIPRPRTSPTVLLACADSDYHSLPLHALAAALAEREVPTRMLGSGLPPHALAASVRRTGPSVMFARMHGADAGDSDSLRRQRPAPTIILAGPGWRPDSMPASARTASSLIEAVDEVLRAIHA
jgi:transposase-like protein